jgi:hypothetical protein
MVEKARAGKLHLDRSFYGRLSEKVGAHWCKPHEALDIQIFDELWQIWVDGGLMEMALIAKVASKKIGGRKQPRKAHGRLAKSIFWMGLYKGEMLGLKIDSGWLPPPSKLVWIYPARHQFAITVAFVGDIPAFDARDAFSKCRLFRSGSIVGNSRWLHLFIDPLA